MQIKHSNNMAKEIKVLLINPPRLNGNPMVREMRCAGLSIVSIYPPIELAYLAGHLRKYAEVKIMDANALNQNFNDIETEIINFKPEVIIFTTSPASFSYDAQIAKISKRIDEKIKTILLDSHISPVMPEKIKRNFPEIDYLVSQEPLLSIPNLLGFEGVIEFENHSLPAYDLLPIAKYSSLTFSRKKPFATIITSAGCSNRCNFCIVGGATVDRGYGKIWRFKSPGKILDEIKYLVSLGIKSIYFFDETFTVDRQRVLEFCKMMIDAKIKIDWACNGRVDTLDEELIKVMKMAGCWNIMFGIECGSEGLLEKANKGTTLTKAIEVVKHCKENMINVSASFVIGFPYETMETIKQTLKIAKKINPYRAQFVILTPYPGTKLYEEVKNKGLLEKDYLFSGYDAYCVNQVPAIRTEKLSSRDLLKAQKYIYRKFYLRPSFVLHTLFSIRFFNQLLNILKSTQYLK